MSVATTGRSHVEHGRAREEDQRVFLHGLSWPEFEAFLAMKGDQPGVRVHYLWGELELMSPSKKHEGIAKMLARLVEAYAEERGLSLNGFKSWTLKREVAESGAEPDECYILGDPEGREKPDLAIEVIWTSGGLDKLAIYRGLGVPEVWFWEEAAVVPYVLREGGYELRPRSLLLPGLDLEALARLAERPDQTEAVREFRARLRAEPDPGPAHSG